MARLRVASKEWFAGCRLEQAFNEVLHIGDVDLVDWLCSQIEPGELFAREPFPLSQGVLLSLVSQLTTNLHKVNLQLAHLCHAA